LANALVKEYPSRAVNHLQLRCTYPEKPDIVAQTESALAEETWICSACRQPHRNWRAQCAGCHQVNTLQWSTPTEVVES
jgi:hypothetical protein